MKGLRQIKLRFSQSSKRSQSGGGESRTRVRS